MTRLSFAQARALGIDERVIRLAEEQAAQGDRVLSDVLRDHYKIIVEEPPNIGAEEPSKPKQAKRDDGYNSKLNRDFAECLKQAKGDGWIREWWYEPFGLRLAPKCYYHFDFLVEPLYPVDLAEPSQFTEHRLVCIEVKGGWFRDDAKVKTKVAAEKFPCFRWLLIYREKRNGWDVREVDHRGIGMSPIRVPWICNL